jgi:hypothetical protein
VIAHRCVVLLFNLTVVLVLYNFDARMYVLRTFKPVNTRHIIIQS